jgi:hypothetical protein
MVMPVHVGGGLNWWQFLRRRRELREESNRRRRELRNAFQSGPMPPDVRDAFERLANLRAEAAEVSDAEVAAFRSLTEAQVERQADRGMAELDERRRIEGHAETLSATEDDWVKLQGLLNLRPRVMGSESPTTERGGFGGLCLSYLARES